MKRGGLVVVTNPAPESQWDRRLGPASVGEGVRLLRHRARLTRDALAEAAGISAGAISNYENGVSSPAALTLRRLALAFAEALDADPVELWDQFGEILDRQASVTASDS